MSPDTLYQHFTAALDALVAQIKQDRSILAVMLCGSLSHDTVWAQSDIDLALVTIDDRKVEGDFVSLNADDVNVHAMLVSRTKFRQLVEGSLTHSFMHSFLSKGRLLYTHDETIADLCDRMRAMGERDRRIQLLRSALHALPSISKAHKWLVTRGDLDYTALWLLYAATPLAQIEVISAGLLVDREVVPQALALNPAFFKTIYADLLNSKKTRKAIEGALQAADEYVAARAPRLFAAVLEYLRDAGEARSASEIETFFKRQLDVSGAITACEYLADQGTIEKVSIAARLTRRSNVDVQELAFVYCGPAR
jgi:polymorphic toxin system nucleotidyltransferase-like protein